MKPLVIDTSIWIDWLNGKRAESREQVRGRILLLPAVVALELLSGAKERKAARVIQGLVSSFERHHRLLLPSKEEFFAAGEILADLGWAASKKSNDALIVACARKVGADVMTGDLSDFAPLAKAFSVSIF